MCYPQNGKIVKISRNELYEQVWSEPVTQLAKRYGFSDVWLAKICKKNDIPRPPRGYWAQMQSGKKLPKIHLPKRKDNPIIVINVRPQKLKEENILFKKTIAERQIIPAIIIPEVLNEPHPFVLKSAEILSLCKPNSTGILIPPVNACCLDIRVSRDSLSRALRIMDALIKNFDTMGFEVSICEKATNVKILAVSLSLSIGEELYSRRLRAKDHKLDGYYRFGFGLYEDQPIPSGILVLTIGDLGFYSAGECRKNWRDTESRRLEDSLKFFIPGLIKVAALKKTRIGATNEQG
jgi:hypothetical protein